MLVMCPAGKGVKVLVGPFCGQSPEASGVSPSPGIALGVEGLGQ